MARAHVLDGNGVTRIVFHIAVPAGNNSAGVSWANAVKNSGVGGTTILPDGAGTGGTIDATEKAAIVAGTTYEFVRSDVPVPNGMNAGQANTYLDALHAAATIEVQAQLQNRLRYFGFTRV